MAQIFVAFSEKLNFTVSILEALIQHVFVPTGSKRPENSDIKQFVRLFPLILAIISYSTLDFYIKDGSKSKAQRVLNYSNQIKPQIFILNISRGTKRGGPGVMSCPHPDFAGMYRKENWIKYIVLKFIYSEKVTKFCEIFTNYLTGSTQDK